jgi:NADH-quinone oxidoreductase subunit N
MLTLLASSIGVPVTPLGPLARPPVAYTAIMPELILLGGALGVLVLASLTSRRLHTMVHAAATIAVSLAAMGWTMIVLWPRVTGHGSGPHGAFSALSGMVAVDGFTLLVFVLVEASIILGVAVCAAWLEREGINGPELYVLAMFSGAGAMLMATANDLILIFLGLEILSIPLYVLAGLNARREDSGEAAMKYFVLGAFSSAIFIYGVALTYGATGSTNLAQIGTFLSNNVLASDGLVLAGMALLLVGFSFKIAAVPFHTWTPDVYQGAPSPVTGFMAAVAKAGGFAALLRVFFSALPTLRLAWQPAIWVLAVLSLVVGAVLAVMQTDIKRMMAYSSISHAGFVVVGLYAATAAGISGSLYYLLAYAFMVIGTFAVITVVGGAGDGNHRIEAYRGLARRNPVLAACMTVLLVAQAGIPFTTGFLAKFYVIAAVVAQGQYVIAVIAMVSAVIAAFFYLRVVVVMYTPALRAGDPGGRPQLSLAGVRMPVLAGSATAGSAGGSAAGGPAGGLAAGGPVGGLATGRSAGGPRVSGGLSGDELDGLVLASTACELATDGGPKMASVGGSALAADAGSALAAPVLPKLVAAGLERVRVPVVIWAVLFVTVVVTVGFGLYPAPLVDFAKQATLLF